MIPSLRRRRAKPARDLTGAIRWILVRDGAGKKPLRFHYPSEAIAESCASRGERAVMVRITGRGGPFSDCIERLDGEPSA